MACLQQGATAVPLATLDVERMLSLIANERISVLPGPPTLFVELLDARTRVDTDSLRVGFVGAASVPPELLRRVREELPFESLFTGYGLTESTALVSITHPDEEPERIAYWNGGYPLDGVEVAVVDDGGATLPPDTAGEIVVRGFNVMRGYYEDPEATATVVDDDGWLHTGDIGMRSARGELRIFDRKKDIYISGGFNVSPAEVESLLLGCDAIAQVAVIGVPDRRLGEVGAAYVVARADADLTVDGVIAWAHEHLANYKVPRHVEIVDTLPLNATGKVMKHVLRRRYQAATPSPSG
jgi:acyl-CoA synthetase (AMP-forming)/AMP-acid ligase II